ncbi:MAG: P-loop NTPase fold protein [Caldisericales bacterium]|nr:KAP family NTPase [bacterium]
MPREDQIITAKSDKPIAKCDEDIFGWKDHARMLAKLITHESNDDVALGISASWGSGKTSMLNLIKEQINELGIKPKPIIVEFDPWFYGSEEKVIHSFFETLIKAIFEKKHPIKDFLSKKLKSFSTMLYKIPDLPSDPNHPGLSEGVNMTKKVASAAGSAISDKIGVGSLESCSDVKKSLDHSSKKPQKNNTHPAIIVFIDDLDRLQADEALTMLKIIRLVTDLPCIRTIVAFDEEATGQLISNKFNIDGINYIRKMINVPTYLPHISKNGLKQYFIKEIEDVLITNDYTYDKKSFSQVVDKISEIVETLRCIKIILNTYKIGISAVGDYVDPVDYLVLCVFFNLAPTLFNALKKNIVSLPLIFNNNRPDDNRIVHNNELSDKVQKVMENYKIDDYGSAKIIDDLLNIVFKGFEHGQVPHNFYNRIDNKNICWVDNHKYYFSLLQNLESADS